MRAALLAFVAALAVAAAFAPVGSATNECHGIPSCIRVPGPWVIVPAHGTAGYLLTCPDGRSVVGGLDAQATHATCASRSTAGSARRSSRARRRPGTRSSTPSRCPAKRQAFQPLLGCIPTQGGGGRSTVSARVVPVGQPLEYRSRIVVVGPGDVKFGRVACQKTEKLVGAWHAIAFRTKQPPNLANVGLVSARHAIVGKKVVVTASSTDALSPDAHAIVQVGAECAP